MHDAGAAAGLDKGHVFIPPDFIFNADAAVELDKICADAKQNVLAVVDHFSGARMLVGRGTSAEERAAFEEGDAETGVGESAGGGEAGEAAASYGYGGLRGCVHLCSTTNSRFLTGLSARFGMTNFFTEL